MIGKCHGGPLDGRHVEQRGTQFMVHRNLGPDPKNPEYLLVESIKYAWDWDTGAFYCVGTS
jgi:hypothetical protein